MKLLAENEYTVKEYAQLRGCTIPYIYQLAKEVKIGKKTAQKAGFRLVKKRGINTIVINEIKDKP